MSVQIFGIQNDKISDGLKCWVSGISDDGSGSIVCGLIGEGTSRELSQNWQSPFETDTLRSAISNMGGGAGKAFTKGVDFSGKTLTTVMNSRQVWESANMTLSLSLKFQAFSNPLVEVSDAIRMLEIFASPDLKEMFPISASDAMESFSQNGNFDGLTGRQPRPVEVNLGRKIILPGMVIKSVSTPLDKEKDKDGNLLRADVNLILEPLEIFHKGNIGKTWPH